METLVYTVMINITNFCLGLFHPDATAAQVAGQPALDRPACHLAARKQTKHIPLLARPKFSMYLKCNGFRENHDNWTNRIYARLVRLVFIYLSLTYMFLKIQTLSSCLKNIPKTIDTFCYPWVKRIFASIFHKLNLFGQVKLLLVLLNFLVSLPRLSAILVFNLIGTKRFTKDLQSGPILFHGELNDSLVSWMTLRWVEWLCGEWMNL